MLATLEDYRAVFQDYLHAYCEMRHRRLVQLDAAIRYALLGEGKRVRPMLLMLSAQALGADPRLALRPALAIELLHTWSLIHDDLPCMDDDDLRRGRATVHKKFSEADALLAGDALLSDAFYLLSSNTKLSRTEKLLPLATRTNLAALCARAVGSRGMVYGQHLDSHAQQPTRAQLCAMQRAKTGWLMAAACGGGALVANQAQVLQFVRLGLRIGLVFQILDDLSDNDQHGASWLALLPAAQVPTEVARQMARVHHTLAQLQLQPTLLAHFIATLALHT